MVWVSSLPSNLCRSCLAHRRWEPSICNGACLVTKVVEEVIAGNNVINIRVRFVVRAASGLEASSDCKLW